jgi:hypothetical protein
LGVQAPTKSLQSVHFSSLLIPNIRVAGTQ